MMRERMVQNRSVLPARLLAVGMLVLGLLLCPPVWSGGATEETKPAAAAAEEAFDLEALIQAAQAEGELVVYHTSSRVKVAGENFEKMYGIKVNGTKMADPEQAERVIREVDSGNVQVDAIGFEDGPLLESKLIPEGYIISWMPPDLKDVVSDADQYPVVDRWQPRVFCYNFDSYPSGSPVKNVWELTEPKWAGKVILRDPALTPANLAWFATIVSQPEILEKAYRDLYGKPLQLTEENAGWEYLKRLFENDLVGMKSDGDIGDAVGAAGQKNAPIGMVTMTKLRDNKDKNLKLAVCKGLEPFMGYALPTYALTVNKAPHPNAAKLWVRFMLTSEGSAPWTLDDMGCYSPNRTLIYHPDNEIPWSEWAPHLLRLDNKRGMALRQDILDFWLEHGAK
jgi:ABC-type Fe3+ transport system substrate-binding protein